MKIFGGDIAKIRRTLTYKPIEMKNHIESMRSTIESVSRYMKPEEAKKLNHHWKRFEIEMLAIRDELKASRKILTAASKEDYSYAWLLWACDGDMRQTKHEPGLGYLERLTVEEAETVREVWEE